jgi:dCTP diphosphatase
MSTIKELQDLVIKFRDERDWKQFHNPKDCALSLVLESAEVLEHFQWKNGEDITEHLDKEKESLSHELADVLYWVLLMSHDLNIDIAEIFKKKLKLNWEKYPVEKAKGRSIKYNQF